MKSKQINSLRNNITRHTIKIISIFISFILLAGSFIVSSLQYKTISQDSENALTNVCNLINRDLDIYVTNSINITNNLEILKILRNTTEDSVQKKVEDSLSLSTYLSMFDNNSQNKVEYVIFTDNNTLYNTKYVQNLSNCPDYAMLKEIDILKSDIFWTSATAESYTFYQVFDTKAKYKSFLRVSIPKKMFDTYLINSNNGKYTVSLEESVSGIDKKEIIINNGSSVFCSIAPYVLPRLYLTNLLYVFLIFLLCYVIIVIVVRISTNNLTKSIYSFLDRLKLNYLSNDSSTDASDLYEEFIVIEQKFLELAEVLKEKNDRISEIDDERKTLELELWQSKFNPHLLYNSLSVIKWNIIKNESIENTTKLIDILTAYYRKILNKNNLCISLNEEIQLLKSYIEIMEYAHSQHYSFEYNVSKELADYPIIKHSLQPLIENAVLHGLNQVEDAKIRLDAFCQDGRNFIQISDNGRGMSKEKIDEILSDSYTSVYKSYGMRNTRQRLLIFFGKENFDFKVTSAPSKGTTITISW